MRKHFAFLVITLFQANLYAQTLPKNRNQANWQQKVDYTIEAHLNVKTKVLNAFETITYYNQSPNEIKEIYMHLWPNAYKNTNTAYAKQDLENGKTNFYFSDPKDRGYIDSLDFKVNGEKVKWELTENIDIAKIILSQTLMPGQMLQLSTPFRVKIPAVFSRAGFEDGIFCMTQWYPKPAVYDVNGWNPIPYLNQGEFYSEFGKYDVSITLPKNYVLAATGEVQDPKEKQWWLQRSKNLKAKHFAPDSLKTLRFVQDSVHDFAWFCSEDFMCDRSEVLLANGKTVETWIFAKSKNEKDKPNGIEYVDEAVTYYSEKVGNYPYSIAQVVITPLKAGGGMEYPTITNCASIDETVIVHEVGHNWFYGILASNEREYPWMDESFNTYYENRNSKENKGDFEQGANFNLLKAFTNFDQSNFLFQYASRRNSDQAGNLHANRYIDNNYGAIIYAKNPIGIGYLQAYLGKEQFDAMMQAYFEKWKFKHPLPDDFKQHAESFTKQNLDWFFNGVLGSTQKMDYKIVSAKTGEVKIKNRGELIAPLPVSILNEDSVLKTIWFEGFKGTKTLSMPNYPYTNEALIYRIDGNKNTLDLYRQNNTAIIKGTCESCAKLKIQAIGNLENNNAAQVFVAPVYAFNMYNKSMFGLAIYNSLWPQKRNEYILMPVYSTTSKNLNGYAQYWHNWYTTGKIKNIQVGFKAARFASKGTYFNTGNKEIQAFISDSGYANYYGGITYEKFAPFVSFKLQPKNRRSLIERELQLRYVMINEQAADRSYLYQFAKDHYGVAEIKFNFSKDHALYPHNGSFVLQTGLHNVSFNKLGLELNQGFLYKDGKKKAQIRLFTGAFLFQKTAITHSRNDIFSSRAFFQGAGKNGKNDVLYDETMMGRQEQLQNIANPLNPGNSSAENFYGRQILMSDAGFRNFAQVGSSNSIMSALNLTLPVPVIPLPIGFYADFSHWQSPSGYITVSGVAGVTTSYYPSLMNLTYNAGLYASLFKGTVAVYVPFISSQDLKYFWETNGYNTLFSRTSIMINLNKMNPIALIRDIKL